MGLFGSGPTVLDKGLAAFKRRDWKRARKLLARADVEDASASGSYHLGLLQWRGLGGPRDVHKATRHFARAADDGHPGAQTALALALRSGVGAPKDLEAAHQLFRLAASSGDAEAMTQLATMSEPSEARQWLLRASELGHPVAMLHLSDLIMRDEPVEALAWLYASVAVSGDHACRKRAAALAREMSAIEIEAAQKAGRSYAKDVQNKAKARAGADA